MKAIATKDKEQHRHRIREKHWKQRLTANEKKCSLRIKDYSMVLRLQMKLRQVIVVQLNECKMAKHMLRIWNLKRSDE